MSKVLLTGANGFLGKHVNEELKRQFYHVFECQGRNHYDLTLEEDVQNLYNDSQPEIVIHLAADVGGIGANQLNPGSFFFNNAIMGLYMVEYARLNNVKKFVYISTVCSYPKFCPTPFAENYIWNGYPEETNAPYGIAKKSIMTMLQAYKEQYNMDSCVLIPTNLYGPHDNFDDSKSHVIAALIKKFLKAVQQNINSVTVWGTGKATRDFLYVSDAARAIVSSIQTVDNPYPINIGSGTEVSIYDLAHKIAKLVGYKGKIVFDSKKPDGQPRRLLDITLAKEKLDWTPEIDFDTGLSYTIDWVRGSDNINGVERST